MMTKCFICWCKPWAEEGIALLEKAAGQGHAYAMRTLGCIYNEWKEYAQAVKWITKAAEAGMPQAMFELGCHLNEGQGVAAPDYPAAAGWFKRAAGVGHGDAASNLNRYYNFGIGWAW